MPDWVAHLFDTSVFPPRWYCGQWPASLGWLHIVSDVATWAAYTAIPVVLAYFVLRRRDVVFPGVFWLFCAFILSCGLVHLIEAAIFWWPAYRLSGILKAITAAVSWAAVICLAKVTPAALDLPGQADLNQALRKEIRERERAEHKFRTVVEAAPNGIVMVDRKGMIVLVNSQTEKMFGYPRDELLDQPVEKLVPEPFRKHHPQERERYVASPRAVPMSGRGDLFGVRKDGSEFPVEIGLQPIETEEGLFVLASVIDITERKKIAEELAARNRDLETLLYVASHDLKEPLRALRTFSETVNKKYADRLDEKGCDYLRRIARAAKRLDGLLDDVLVLSRARRMEAPNKEVTARELVRAAMQPLAHQIRETNARVHVAKDLPRLRVNSEWVTHALFNLIGNAIKFTGPGAAADIEVAAYRADGQVGISVMDRGPGVAPEHAGKIFDLFQRAVGRHVQGSGAGLAIVRQVAERHGGRAWVEPRPGGGSIFTITFGPEPGMECGDSKCTADRVKS